MYLSSLSIAMRKLSIESVCGVNQTRFGFIVYVQVHRCTRVYLHLCKIEVYYYYLIIFYTLPLLPRYLLYWFSVSVLVNCVRVHVDLVFFSFSLSSCNPSIVFVTVYTGATDEPRGADTIPPPPSHHNSIYFSDNPTILQTATSAGWKTICRITN